MSSLFSSVMLKAVKARGKPTQKGILEVAGKQKAADLSATLTLRAEEGDLAASTISDFERAAEDYVDGLINTKFPDSLDFLLSLRDNEFDEEEEVQIKSVYGIRDKQGKIMSALTLTTLLNLVLYQYAKELMESPRLNWRTGRLAHSGKVVAVTPEGKGVGSIMFTYMLYPYAVFEPGSESPLASEARSPNALFTLAIQNALQDILSPKSTQFIVRSA